MIKPNLGNKITFTNVETGWTLWQRIEIEGKVYHVTKIISDTEIVIEHNTDPFDYAEIKYEWRKK
jgi:hypothetical protein